MNINNSKVSLMFRERKTDKLRKQTKLGPQENFDFGFRKLSKSFSFNISLILERLRLFGKISVEA